MTTLADFVWVLCVGVAESVPVTLMLNVPFTLYVVLKVDTVPEDGLPPVAVQANVTGGVPPDADAEQDTAVPTVPVAGQVIVTTRVPPTWWVAVASLPLVSVTFSVKVKGPGGEEV